MLAKLNEEKYLVDQVGISGKMGETSLHSDWSSYKYVGLRFRHPSPCLVVTR